MALSAGQGGQRECVAELLGHGIRETVVAAGQRVAPLGAELVGERVLLRPYYEARIGWALLRHGQATINVVGDSLQFYKALMGEAQVDPETGVLRGADAYIRAILDIAIISRPRLELRFVPVECKYMVARPQAYTRANTLLLEILVRYTRIPAFVSKGWGIRAPRMYHECVEMARTIRRVAPDSEYSRAADRLLEKLSAVVETLVG